MIIVLKKKLHETQGSQSKFHDWRVLIERNSLSVDDNI